jgi:hypothetical protein
MPGGGFVNEWSEVGRQTDNDYQRNAEAEGIMPDPDFREDRRQARLARALHVEHVEHVEHVGRNGHPRRSWVRRGILGLALGSVGYLITSCFFEAGLHQPKIDRGKFRFGHHPDVAP